MDDPANRGKSVPEFSDEEERRRQAAKGSPQQPPGGTNIDPTMQPQEAVVPPILASGSPQTPEVQAARIANARHFADSARSNAELNPVQRAERIALSQAQGDATATLADPKSRISAADRTFVDPSTPEGQRNLRRAADPDKSLGTSTIDEARTMDMAERTGQLPGLVDRSGVPGADVKTTVLDERGEVANQTDWSMKGVRATNPKQLAASMGVATGEIENLANNRVRGNPSPEFIGDLKNITDEKQLAAIEAQLRAQLQAQNQRIEKSGSAQPPIQMRTVIDPEILKRRQEAARAAAAAGGGTTP